MVYGGESSEGQTSVSREKVRPLLPFLTAVNRRTHSPLIALTHRNFRLIWLALLFSLSGSFMQNAALLWHVSILVAPEQKGLALGAVGLARILPIFGLSLMSGV